MSFVGLNSKAIDYNAFRSPNVTIANRAPVSTDYRNQVVMDEWYDTSSTDWYKLLSLAGNVALWVLQSSTPSSINQINANTGSVTAIGGQVNAFGGTGANTTGSGQTLTINVRGIGLSWNNIVGTSQVAAVNNGYWANNALLVSVSLPVASAVGDALAIVNLGSGNVRITQGAGQQMRIGASTTTLGGAGFIQSTNLGDGILLVCQTANLTWVQVPGTQGNWNTN